MGLGKEGVEGARIVFQAFSVHGEGVCVSNNVWSAGKKKQKICLWVCVCVCVCVCVYVCMHVQVGGRMRLSLGETWNLWIHSVCKALIGFKLGLGLVVFVCVSVYVFVNKGGFVCVRVCMCVCAKCVCVQPQNADGEQGAWWVNECEIGRWHR